MNEFDKNKKIETLLEETAEQVQPNLMFKAELEEKLRKAHKPRTGLTFPRFNNLASVLTGVVVLGALALFTLWIFQSLEPQNNFGNNNFSCPVTEPNGSVPPGENMQDPYFYGNGEIWTTLWPEGRVVMQNDNLEPDGAFAMKWLIYRGVTGELSIEGRRLDADADPLRAFISDGYGDNGVQILALIFPTTGCWEVTARVGDSSLTFVTEVIYNDEIVSTPDAISDPSLTPTDVTIGGYDFRGGKLFLAQPLPQSPASANVFALQDYPPATLEQARALADRFGFQGELYTAPGRIPDTTDYVITDGKRLLSVSTEGSFYYTTDMVKNNRGFTGKSYDNAEAIIRDFLNSHGFNFDFQVSESGFGSYLIHPLSEEGTSIQYESFTDPIIRAVLDENGEVLRLDVNLVNYDQNALGTYEILSAEEALQAILASNSATRVLETMYPAPHAGPQQWYRDHADEEKVTIYGALGIFASIDAAKPSLYFIDGMPVVGNTSGLEEIGNYVLVEANGQFVTENGNRKFIVDSWSHNVDLGFYSGTVRNENGQILFAFDDGSGTEYPLIDPPADVPLNTQTPESQLLINGNIKDGMFNWTSIQYFADSSQMGGGGGGGGLGFYPLNLSGTPIPFPTPAESSIPSANLDTTNALTYVVQEGDTLSQIASMYGLTPEQLMQANGLTEMTIVIGQSLLIPGTTAPPQLDGARGMLNITIYTREDGSERTQYAFLSSDPQYPYMILEGNGLEELLPYHNKPIRVWGSADHLGQFGAPVISMERFEILFPDLQFQLMTGTEELVQLEGKDVVLLTTDSGEQYVEFGGNCSDVFGYESMSSKRDNVEKMQLEVLAVPDLSFGGYPVICVFSTGIATDQNGNAYGMEMTASQPYTIPEPVFGTGSQPNLTIDSVDLIYYASNPNILLYDPTLTERYPYMQPVWRFLGTYDTGEKVEFAVQALKQEYLSPDSNP